MRWDPNRENILFLNQSAFLYSQYYQLQIAVHRPFIPSPRKPSPLSFPSLAICTNAARSCTHVLDVPYQRSKMVLVYNQVCVNLDYGSWRLASLFFEARADDVLDYSPCTFRSRSSHRRLFYSSISGAENDPV